MTRQHRMVVIAVMWVLASAVPPAKLSAQQVGPVATASETVAIDSESAAMNAFDAAIQEYLALRQSLENEVPPMRVTSSVAEIDRASDMLAIAIERARPNAAQGDFFSPSVARTFQRRLVQALGGADLAALIDRDDPEERSDIRAMKAHARFPTGQPLATMPPSALHALPPLPDALEYRFVGTSLVLRDRNARLILDYIPGVLQSR